MRDTLLAHSWINIYASHASSAGCRTSHGSNRLPPAPPQPSFLTLPPSTLPRASSALHRLGGERARVRNLGANLVILLVGVNSSPQ